MFFGVIGYLIVHSAGWPAFKQSFFNAEEFRVSFPLILRKFIRNIYIFIVAEVLVLSLALLLAVLRSIPGPVFAPLRFLSAAIRTSSARCPTILVIFLLGYGIPALGLQGVPESDLFWAIVALTLVYSAYVAEVYRAGIESVHPSQAAAARSLGLRRWQAMRYVVLPQAVRRVIPPLLNDFIGLQKDTALVVVHRRRSRPSGRRRSTQAATFNFTPYLVAALLFLAAHDPAGAVHRLAGRARPAPAPSGGTASPMTESAIASIEGLHKSFGDARGAARDRPDVARARGGLPHRRVRSRQVARCCAASTGSSRSTPGGSSSRARRHRRRASTSTRVRRRIGIVFQAFNLFPHMTVLDNVTLGPRKVLASSRRRGRRRALGAARAVRPGRQARRVPRPAVRRPAAARRDRPGARDAAATCCCSTRSPARSTPSWSAEVLDVDPGAGRRRA